VDAKPDRRMPQIERGTHARTDGHSTNSAAAAPCRTGDVSIKMFRTVAQPGEPGGTPLREIGFTRKFLAAPLS